jgi:hypothetical protein
VLRLQPQRGGKSEDRTPSTPRFSLGVAIRSRPTGVRTALVRVFTCTESDNEPATGPSTRPLLDAKDGQGNRSHSGLRCSQSEVSAFTTASSCELAQRGGNASVDNVALERGESRISGRSVLSAAQCSDFQVKGKGTNTPFREEGVKIWLVNNDVAVQGGGREDLVTSRVVA